MHTQKVIIFVWPALIKSPSFALSALTKTTIEMTWSKHASGPLCKYSPLVQSLQN